MLFKVAGSASGVSGAEVHLVGDRTVTGSVTSGGFCGTGTPYSLYFVALFDRPFGRQGTWGPAGVAAGARGCRGARCGAYVSFDTTRDDAVMMKVGISFVGMRGAFENLRHEDPGWSLAQIETAAADRWNRMLGRVRVGGGTLPERRTFYSALYHSLLHPNVVSDDDGSYVGSDGRIHRVATGARYSNFSEWDIYRSEIQLVSLLAPGPASDMVQSLVDDARTGGWLPKWAIVGGDSSQMNGDSADPVIASTYAFGARAFDQGAAFAAMMKGATRTESGHGLQIERQYLSQYLSQHFIDASALDLTSIDYSIGGSVTLEYALDDFAIAQMALARGDRALYSTLMRRAHSWQYLFNPATGFVQARGADGAFPPGSAFETSQLEAGGQLGFEEGNAVQYTWAVPQDLFALATLMGGDSAAVRELDVFFTHLNAGRALPYDWAGNEPGLWAPWEYDYFGAPWRTQDVVHRIMSTLYSDAPVDEPGNDDLGALSSWYVWAAIGLYPVTPGTANLAISSPLFPRVTVTLPSGRSLTIDAPGASSDTRYIRSLEVRGDPVAASVTSCSSGSSRLVSRRTGEWDQPWLPASVIETGAHLVFSLSERPDPAWGAAPGARPPSFAVGRLPSVGYTVPSGRGTVRTGQPSAITFGVRSAQANGGAVRWRATTTGGLTLTPSSGVLPSSPTSETGSPVGAGSCVNAAPVSRTLSVTAPVAGSGSIVFQLEAADGTALPPVVLNVSASSP